MKDSTRTALIQLIDKFSDNDGIHGTAIAGVQVMKMAQVDMRIPTVYNPSLCFIVQGRKQVLVDDTVYRYKPSEYLAVSVELPVTGQVTRASAQEPYLGLQIDIDPVQLGELLSQMAPSMVPEANSYHGIFVGKLEDDLGDCVLRLVRLLETPMDIPILAPAILREIYYRLLISKYGQAFAQTALAGSKMQRIHHALKRIKQDYNKPLQVSDLADAAGMSVSSFHFHFKHVTGLSPMQYQKRLRLIEARRLMWLESFNAEEAAYRVGYESPSQFNREYARLFSLPPMRDMASLR